MLTTARLTRLVHLAHLAHPAHPAHLAHLPYLVSCAPRLLEEGGAGQRQGSASVYLLKLREQPR